MLYEGRQCVVLTRKRECKKMEEGAEEKGLQRETETKKVLKRKA